MTPMFVATGVLLAVAGLLVLVRLLAGPSLADRLVALDTLVILLVCAITVRAAYIGEVHTLVLLVLVTLVGALSTLSAVRLLPREDQ